MKIKYTDHYIEYALHDLDIIFNLITISLTKFIDPDENAQLRALTAAALNTCSTLIVNIGNHYAKENLGQ